MTASYRARFSIPLLATLTFAATSLAAAQGVEAPRVPLRTAIEEINTLRSEYMDHYNRKDAAALKDMYLPDAVMIRRDGSTLVGQAAIGKALAAEAEGWRQVTISSDTMRVFGNTAWDVGSMNSVGSGDEANVSHYLVVLRRGLREWKISSVAVVPALRATVSK